MIIQSRILSLPRYSLISASPSSRDATRAHRRSALDLVQCKRTHRMPKGSVSWSSSIRFSERDSCSHSNFTTLWHRSVAQKFLVGQREHYL